MTATPTHKSVHPYDYMNSSQPIQTSFDRQLYEENIIDKYYVRASVVWKI